MPNNKKSLWPLNKIDDCFALKKLDMNSKGINFSWELVPELNKILKRTVTSITIAPDARISRNATIEGPVIIESKVAIQDYAKIVGPAYICEGTLVGHRDPILPIVSLEIMLTSVVAPLSLACGLITRPLGTQALSNLDR